MNGAAGFELHTVVHLIRPWGRPLQNLESMREALAGASAEVLFHHTVQVLYRDRAASEHPADDLSAWVAVVVQDREIAERLSFAVQDLDHTAEEVREALVSVLDALTPEERAARQAPREGALQLLAAESLPLATGVVVHDGEELVAALTGGDPAVWFYHIIEQPWFGAGACPVAEWLEARGEPRLATWLREAAQPTHSLERSRDRLLRRWRQSRLTRRVADASGAPEDERRRAGREAVARLVRRVTRTENPA